MVLLIYGALGAIAGFIAGLFGVGGGLIIVPALIWVFSWQNVDPSIATHLAVGTSLATITFTAISSIRAHHLQGHVSWRLFLWLSLGIMVGAILGAKTVDQLAGPYLQALIGAFAILVSLQLFFQIMPNAQRELPSPRGLTLAGGVIGWISSMFGIGGGAMTVPFLVFHQTPMKQAVGTAAACGLPIAVFGAIGFAWQAWGYETLPSYSTGYIYWPAVAGIIVTSVLTARVGAYVAHRLPAGMLKRLFAVLLLAIGGHLLSSGLLA